MYGRSLKCRKQLLGHRGFHHFNVNQTQTDSEVTLPRHTKGVVNKGARCVVA